MGREYKAALQQRIQELGGGENLRVYINGEGVSEHYLKHLEETFEEAGVRFVDSREEANFFFAGHAEPKPLGGQVAAFFSGGQLAFVGSL